MSRTSSFGTFLSLAFAASLAAADRPVASTPSLSAATIVDKNVAARGGLSAWHAVQSMSMEGKLGAGGNRRAAFLTPTPTRRGKREPDDLTVRAVEEVFLPFTLKVERPHKSRFELQFKGQTAVQVFDGTNGWKLRPFLGRRDVEPFTTDELKIASLQPDIDGPLVDYAAKGTRAELAGAETVEDHDTYKLKLTLKNGTVTHVWIDAQTFLEVKMEGQPRRLDGLDHPVEVYYRDYRPVSGLQMPFVLETKVLPVAKTALGLKDNPVPTERTTFDKIVVNPKLEEALFSKPKLEMASNSR